MSDIQADGNNNKDNQVRPSGTRPPLRGSAAPGGPGLVNGAISRHKQAYGYILCDVVVNQNGLRAKRQGIKPPYGITHNTGRKEVKGFSEASRRRMQDKLTTIDWASLRSKSKKAIYPRAVFATLTYPEGYSKDWREWKRHLDNFRKYLMKTYGSQTSVIWKLENQEARCIKTGAEFAPHFHLVIDFKKKIDLRTFRIWLRATWHMVVGSEDVNHLKAGTNASCIYGDTGRLLTYLCKYLSKTYEVKVHTGRVWGVWNKFDLAPSTTYKDVPLVPFARRVRGHGSYSSYLRNINVQKTQGFRMFGSDLEQLLRGLE